MAVTHAPFINGNLQEYIGENYPYKFSHRALTGERDENNRPVYIETPGEWREIQPFSAFMKFSDWERGRSAVRLWWKDQDGHSYPMFMKDFADILHAGKIGSSAMNGKGTGSSVFGFWTVQKRGANYGIRLLIDED